MRNRCVGYEIKSTGRRIVLDRRVGTHKKTEENKNEYQNKVCRFNNKLEEFGYTFFLFFCNGDEIISLLELYG